MKILVTGASGYIGNRLVNALAEQGNKVHAFVRSSSADHLLRHPNIRIFRGDILDKESLQIAVKGCERVFHVAGSVKTGGKDPKEVMNININGTKNVLEEAANNSVSKIVFTSTGGVMGPSLNHPLTEDDLRMMNFELDYEFSKKIAEDLLLDYVKKGGNAVIVRPTKVFGPGYVSHPRTANAIISRFLTSKCIVIPGPGNYYCNFSFLDDVVAGHCLAMENGRSGETYLLGGENISYFSFFDTIRKLGDLKGKIIMAGKKIIIAWALLQEMWQKISGKDIFFNRKVGRYLFCNHEFSSQKAINDLGYRITPFAEAIRLTIDQLYRTKRF